MEMEDDDLCPYPHLIFTSVKNADSTNQTETLYLIVACFGLTTCGKDGQWDS